MKPMICPSLLKPCNLAAGICMLGLLLSCDRGPSPPLSPKEALETMVLADNDLEMELVAAEPLVQDPVAIAFDAGGRLWVVEMLAFMTDIDGSGEKERVGRISVLFDDDGDGQMDRGQVFLDSLVLPRAIGLVKGGALVAENIPLWYAEDLDGDFRADKKILVDSTYGGIGMPEHSANGLMWGMDNWIYNAKSKYRYKRIEGEWVKEETEFRGQWGIAQDNAGRLFYNYNWSQLHADLVPPNSLERNSNHTPNSGIDHGLTLDRKIFPIRSNTAVNRGYVPGTLDENGKLLEFASACGPIVFRGNALPPSYLGDAFVCEPTANLIKQNNILEAGFMLSAEAVYPDKEFLSSTDERFRPVSLASGPDGALYVVDMYKGIIQHGPYMTEYLRKVTLDRHLDKPIHMGRIWRIRSKTKKNAAPTLLEDLEPEELVSQLDNPNGWVRDNAQRLLVEGDGLQVRNELETMAASEKPMGSLHALWTLEGLGVTDASAFLPGLESANAETTQASLRILTALSTQQTTIKSTLEEFIATHYETAPPLVQMQMILSCYALPQELALEKIRKFLQKYGEYPVARDVAMSSLEGREMDLLLRMSSEATAKANQNMEIFMEMLATAITNSGRLEDIKQLLSMSNPYRDHPAEWVKGAILNGILNSRPPEGNKLLALKQKPAEFGENIIEKQPLFSRVAERFTWAGKPEMEIRSEGRAIEVDAAIMARGRQQFLNLCANCHGTQGEGMKRFAPPLQQSEWVNGEDYKLAMILLHGMEGPVSVNGKEYDIPDILPAMPSFSTLQDNDIAAIATYIRNSWGHNNTPLTGRTVGGIRFRTQGKIQPWKAQELDTLQFSAE